MVIAAREGGDEVRGEGPREEDGVVRLAIDVADDAEAAAADQQHYHGICRICQLEEGDGDGALPERVSGRLVKLGCGCRGELAVAHQRCAEAWFTIRGDRCCEICGQNVENIHGGTGAHKFMQQWHYAAGEDGGGSSSSVCGFSKTQSCCNLLIGCLVVMFILPWLRHDHVI